METNEALQSVLEDDAVREVMRAQLVAKREALVNQLAELDAAYKSLGGKSGPRKGGRPKGKRTGPTQRKQILDVLAANPKGLRSGEIAEKTGIPSKNLQTILSNMKNKYEEIKSKGKARKAGGEGFIYSLTAAGKTNQKEEVKSAE